MKNITVPADQPPAVPNKPKRISAKVRTAIDLLVSGDVKTITDAAEKAGLSREHLSRELSKPHVAEHMRQRVLRSLNVASARAGAVKIDLLDSPNEMVRDRASTYVLGLAGITPEGALAATPSDRTPGVCIQIVVQEPQLPAIDVRPLETIRP